MYCQPGVFVLTPLKFQFALFLLVFQVHNLIIRSQNLTQLLYYVNNFNKHFTLTAACQNVIVFKLVQTTKSNEGDLQTAI